MHTDKFALCLALRRLIIKHVFLDYDGEPVIIKDGIILEARPPFQNQVWNSQDLDWEDAPEVDTYPKLSKADFDYWAEGLRP